MGLIPPPGKKKETNPSFSLSPSLYFSVENILIQVLATVPCSNFEIWNQVEGAWWKTKEANVDVMGSHRVYGRF